MKFEAARIGLAEWKARDWFDEMEGCGWLDHKGRRIQRWQSVLARVKTKWEADGRPAHPPSALNYGGGAGNTASQLSPNTKAILLSKELDDIQRKMESMNVDSHVELSTAEADRLAKLKARRREIKAELGWKS